MSNFTTSHAAPNHDLQKILHCQIQALRLEFFSRKPTHIYGPNCKQALLLSCQQSCTSPTTHAGVQAISTGQRHAAMCRPTVIVKLKVISFKTLIFKAKISTTHVALNIGSKAGS